MAKTPTKPRKSRSRIAALEAKVAAQAVALSTYQAAEKTRNTGDWAAKTSSADTIAIGDYSTLLARARAAVRDDWLAASIVDGHVRHVVGSGIRVNPNARDIETNETRKDFNLRMKWLWDRWGRTPAQCDQEGRKTILHMSRLAVREYVTAGQSFTILNYTPRVDGVGLTLQMFEPEQLDTSRYLATNGNAVHNGIEIDKYGRPVAYYAFTEDHPLEYRSTSAVRIPAERVLHLMRQDRCRQTSGISRLAPILRDMWFRKAYEEYMMLRARQEACIGAAIESDPDAAAGEMAGLRGEAGYLTVDGNSNKELRFEPNMLWPLPAGKRVSWHVPSTPGGQYGPYMAQHIKQEAAGAGLDYPTVLRDYTGGSFTSQRQGQLETWAETDPEQIMLVDMWLRPVYEAFTTYAILEGRVDAPGFASSDDERAGYLEAQYMPPAKAWIDPANQAAAAKLKRELHLETFPAQCIELGLDPHEVLQQIADFNKEAEALGIKLEVSPASGAQPGAAVPARGVAMPMIPPADAPDGADMMELELARMGARRNGGRH